jgi:hypothetical protein
MDIIAQGQAQGWDATQWLALLAVVGSLAGVWLGKALEARNHRKLQKVEEAREEARALQEALIQTELLYLRLDPDSLIAQAREGILTTEAEAARVADALRKHADHVQDLLVRAGIQSSSDAVRPVLPALERSLNRSVQELLLILALHSEDQGEPTYNLKSPFNLHTSLKETEGLIRSFREALGLDPNFLAQPLPPKPSPRNERLIKRTKGPLDFIWPGWLSGTRNASGRATNRRHDRMAHQDRLLWKREQKGSSPVTPNLLDLTPQEFEALVAHLLRNMGLEFQHDASNDGGVDGIAADLSSEFGGKLVVQAKRYRHPVPVESVRSLYGEVLHQGASKGIFITTSTFGKSAYSFAINKPLELIDGANLLYLLSEYAGIEANITPEPPR